MNSGSVRAAHGSGIEFGTTMNAARRKTPRPGNDDVYSTRAVADFATATPSRVMVIVPVYKPVSQPVPRLFRPVNQWPLASGRSSVTV